MAGRMSAKRVAIVETRGYNRLVDVHLNSQGKLAFCMKIQGIGKTLRRWREDVLELSIADFADRVGSDKGTISKYENDQLNVTLDLLDEWATKLNDRQYSVAIVFAYLNERYPMFKSLLESSPKG